MSPLPAPNAYKRHRFPAEIISHCVWLYFRFCLSYRDVEELMAERGVVLTYEAVRYWCRKFGQPYANQLRRWRPRPGDTWHLDEVFLTINKQRHYLWRAVDQDGHILDILVQRRRDKKAAKTFFRKLLKGLTYVPRVIVTDRLRSYEAAKREVLPRVEHRQHRCLNNRAENSHQPTRQRERRMQRFKSPGHAQRCLAASGPIASHFRPRRHRLSNPRLPSGHAAPLSHLAGNYRLSHGRIRDARRTPLPSFSLVIVARCVNLTTPGRGTRHWGPAQELKSRKLACIEDSHALAAFSPKSPSWDMGGLVTTCMVRLTLLGVGAMNSPRYAPAGLLVEYRKHRVMLDGGPSAEPRGRLDAWLVTDEQSELMRDIRALARARGVEPGVGPYTSDELILSPRPVVHTSHLTYGYLLEAGNKKVVWAPEFFEFPAWAAGADLMFAEAAGWDRPIRFAGGVGGHSSVLDVAREAQQQGVRQLVFAHIGRPTIRALDAGCRPPFGEFGADGQVYRVRTRQSCPPVGACGPKPMGRRVSFPRKGSMLE
jgi:putative transposase